MELRDYQIKAIQDLRFTYASKKRAPVLVLPTGAGKTVTFSFMASEAAKRGKRVLILVHRTELLKQASATLARNGLKHGLISPGHYGHLEQVAIASVQTLDRRLKREPLHYDFIILDECHRYLAESFRRVVAHFPNAHLLGVTATPTRTDGQGLGIDAGGIFDEIVQGPTMHDLIGRGFLVKPTVYAPPSDIDLTGLKKSKGDFIGSQLTERVDKPSITGSAVEHYLKLAKGEAAIAFCASRVHAEHVCLDFRQAGIRSEVVHGAMDPILRAKHLTDLAARKLDVVCAIDVLTEGTDIPCVSVAILLRPTTSLVVYMQSVGRILRPSPSKHRALILDHVGNTYRFGLPDDDRLWTLEGVAKKKRKSGDEITVRQCKKCFAVWDEGNSCPYCGHVNPPKPRKVIEKDGELKELTREELKKRTAEKTAKLREAKTFEELVEIGTALGYNEFYLLKRFGRKFNIS